MGDNLGTFTQLKLGSRHYGHSYFIRYEKECFHYACLARSHPLRSLNSLDHQACVPVSLRGIEGNLSSMRLWIVVCAVAILLGGLGLMQWIGGTNPTPGGWDCGSEPKGKICFKIPKRHQ